MWQVGLVSVKAGRSCPANGADRLDNATGVSRKRPRSHRDMTETPRRMSRCSPCYRAWPVDGVPVKAQPASGSVSKLPDIAGLPPERSVWGAKECTLAQRGARTLTRARRTKPPALVF